MTMIGPVGMRGITALTTAPSQPLSKPMIAALINIFFTE